MELDFHVSTFDLGDTISVSISKLSSTDCCLPEDNGPVLEDNQESGIM